MTNYSSAVDAAPIVIGEEYYSSITDDDYTLWLQSAELKFPVVLVEAEHSDGIVYFGSYAYVSTVYDSNPSRTYEDLIFGSIEINQRLDRVVIGDILIINDGGHTDWLTNNWKGHNLRILFGDARWRLDDFRVIINGKNNGISAPKSNRYRFGVLDFSEILKTKLASEDGPLCFGETYNVRPTMIDDINLRYKVNDGLIASIVVRDVGVVLTGGGTDYTLDAANGEFDLTASPGGQITCDVSEANTTATEIIKAICGLAPVANENDEVWDIEDAGLKDPYNTNSTAFTDSGGAENLTTPQDSDGEYYISVEANSTPTAGARASIPITTLATVNPSNGDLVLVRGKARHTGTGGDWILAVASDASLSSDVTTIKTLDDSETTWLNFSLVFTFSTAAGGLDYFGLLEANGSNDGGAELRDLEFFHAGISFNTTNLDAFANTDDLGLYVSTSTSIKEMLDKVLNSVGGGYRFNTEGELEIYRLDVPGSSVLDISADDIAEFGVQHDGVEEPIKELTLGYKKNWFVQAADALAGVVTIQNREDFSTEFQVITSENKLPDYPLAKDKRKDTLIKLLADAQTEADRIQVIRSEKRDLYSVKSFLAAGVVSLGDTVKVTYSDYGFSSGVNVVIIGIKRLLGKGIVQLKVWK